MFSIQEILDLAVRLEQNGEAFYREATKQFLDPSLVTLLQWVAEEEVKHADWFSEKKTAWPGGGSGFESKEIERDLLVGILGDQVFSLKEVDFSRIHSVQALVEVAVEFEKDTILFYEFLQSLVGDKETGDKLEEIAEEERLHIKRLEQYLQDSGTQPDRSSS